MDQLDTLIRDVDPARTITIPAGDPEAASRLRERLAARNRRRRRYGVPGGVAAVGALAAVLILLVQPGGSPVRPASAAAAVLTRASAALEQLDEIMQIQLKDYSANGRGPEVLGGNELYGAAIMCVPGPCSGPAAATAHMGISADPSADTLTYSSQEWLTADGSKDHVVYGNGDETASSDSADEYSAYDAADNTLTTLTDMGYVSTPPTPAAPPPNLATMPLLGPFIENPAEMSYYEQLYHEAQAGDQGTFSNGPVQRAVTASLVGQTTIGSEPVDELRFDEQTTLTGQCTPNPCQPASFQLLLYLDGNTFVPVRTVLVTVNPADNPGLPNGTAVEQVIDYSIATLPTTQANESLLQISPHPGATQMQETYAQYRSDHDLYPQAGSTGAAGTTGATGPSGSTGATGTTSTH